MTDKILAARLTIIWCLGFTIVSLGSSILVAMQNVTWAEMDAQAHFMIIVGIVVSWGNTMMAFISKQATKLEEGKPLSLGNTDFLSKTDVLPEPKKT